MRTPTLALAGVLLACTLGLPACRDSSTGGGGVPIFTGHPDVALLDDLGNPIFSGSTEPISSRKTCGECHDVDQIANGYHFQQGRTDRSGALDLRRDYFGDGRSFVRSSGMYGKW